MGDWGAAGELAEGRGSRAEALEDQTKVERHPEVGVQKGVQAKEHGTG